MKILLYSSGEIVGGTQTGGKKRFLELAKLTSKKKEYDICCSDEEDVLKKYGLLSKYRFKQISSNLLSKAIPPEMVLLITNRKLIKTIKKERYDKVIVFDVPPAIGLCIFNVKNIVLMIRKDMIGYEKVKTLNRKSIKYYFKLIYQWISEDICLRKANKIICQCNYDKNVLINRHKHIRKKINDKFCIQINNVNPSWIVEKSMENNSSFALNKNNFNICFVGGFDDKRKGQDLLFEAIDLLRKDGCVFNYNIIGGGNQLEEYKEKYESENIKFWGKMNNPINIMKECDLMVVPSLADSCPNTVMEALYNNITVIGSRAGGIPEILGDEEALFDLNAIALAEKIKKISEDYKFAQKLSIKQVERKKELSFDWGEIILERVIN